MAATCFVIVKEPYHAVERIELSCTDTTLLVGDTLQLTAVVYPANASDPRLTWTSSAPEIVSVDTLGRLTALAAGEATITVSAEYGTVSIDCVVNVETPSSGMFAPENYRIYSRGMTIIIESPANGVVSVTYIDGKVTWLKVRAGTNIYEMNERGMYVVGRKKILLN